MLASQLANTINIYQNVISVPVQSKVYCAQGQKQQQINKKKNQTTLELAYSCMSSGLCLAEKLHVISFRRTGAQTGRSEQGC